MTRDELIEKYRDINVDHGDWWEDTWDRWRTEKLPRLGITVHADDMSFTGFWSQGDGASFIAKVWQQDMTKFMRRHALVRRFPAAWFWSRKPYQALHVDTLRFSHHYSHSNTVRPEVGDDGDVDAWVLGEEIELRRAVFEVWQEKLETEWRDFDDEVCGILRGYMDELYCDLQEDYEALTSDEAVWNTIVANGLDDLDDEDAREAA